MAKQNKFVSELEAEKLAKKHIENFMNECNLQSVDDAKLAIQKMVAVSYNFMETIHKGKAEKLTIN